MSIDVLNGKIRVYNYEQSPVGFPSQHNQQGVFLRGREVDEEYVVERVAFDDVEAENPKSDLFKVGRIRFHPEEEEEIYSKLGIEDKENILTDKQLIELLMTDTIENVKRISDLKSITLVSRMKSMLFTLERSGKMPPHRIISTVVERGNELIGGGKRNPNSAINKILDADKKANEENQLRETLDTLKQEMENLKQEKEAEIKAREAEAKVKDELLAKSQGAIEELLKKVQELTKAAQPEKQEGKPVGRPPKNE